MSFPSALDSGKYTKVRGSQYYADEFMLLGSNTVIFQALVNGTPTGNTYAQVVFDTVSVGAYTDIQQYMTVYISHTSAIQDAFLRTYARKSPTSNVLYIGETSEPITDNDTIFVVRDFALHQKLVRVDGSNYYKNYDEVYVAPKPVIYNLQSAYAGVETGSPLGYTVSFAALAFATAPGATISSYAYTLPSGATATGGSVSTANVTVRFTARQAEYWVKLVVTDSNGSTATRWIPVWAIPADFSTTVNLGFEGAAINASLDAGFNATVPAFEGINDILDQTLCVTFNVEYHDGVQGSIVADIKHVGRIRRDNGTNSADEQASRVLGTSFEIEGMAAQLTRTNVDKIRMVYTASPSVWDEITNLTPWRAVCHLLQHHTTFCEINSLSFTDTSNTYLYPSFITKGQSALDSLKDFIDSINAQMEWAASGEARIVHDLRYGTTAERDAADVIADFEAQDWIEITGLEYLHVDEYGLVDGAAGTFSTANEQEQLIFAKWPGITRGEGFNTDTFARQVLEANLSRAGAQASFRKRIGYRAAVLNTRYRLSVTFPDQYNWIHPTVGAWYTFTVVILEDDLRHEFDTNTRWICESVSTQHDNATGGKTVSAVFASETESVDGQDYYPPTTGDITPATPDIPPFTIYDGGLGDYGSMLPGDLLPPYAPIFTGPTSPLTPIATATDGSVILAVTRDTESSLWITREGLLAKPHWIDITPNLASGELIKAAMWGGLGIPDIYIVASDGTNSHVYYCANGLVSAPDWVSSASITGIAFAIRRGQADGEVIVEKITVSGGSTTLITLSATENNYDTGIVITNGDSVNITASGTWCYSSGPAGCTDANGEANFNPAAQMPSENLGTLIGKIGSGGSWFKIGTSYSFTAGSSGHLYLADNDSAHLDNSGSQSVVVDLNGGAASGLTTIYSTDHGATFATAVSVGTAASPFGGFDTQKNGNIVLAAASGQMRKNTLSGASYADYSTPLEQGAAYIPYYKLGSTTLQNNSSTPDYILNSDIAVAGESLWKITAAGATITNITPTDSGNEGLATSPNNLIMPLRSGQIIIGVFKFGSSRKIARSLNSGTSWTKSSAVNAAADYVETRVNDRLNRQLWFANGTSGVGYIKNYQTSLTVNNKPLPTSDPVVIVDVYG